jgi:hemoglobin-like flavoprotein
MTPKQIDLVEASWTKILPIEDKIATFFYDKLFTLDPGLKALFVGDIDEQGRKLVSMIDVAVSSLGRVDTIVPDLQALIRRYVDYDFKDSDYDTAGIALIWALEQGLGDAFTADVRSAWIKTYALLAEVMKEALTDEVTYGFTD